MSISFLVILSLVLVAFMLLVGCAQQPAEPAQQPTITPDETTEPAKPSVQTTEENGEPSTFTITVPDYYERATVEEIPSLIVGRIPLPTYLPEGCEIKEVYVGDVSYGEAATVYFIISDRDIKHIGSEVECLMVLRIYWPAVAGGLKITPEMYRRWQEGKPYRTSVWQSAISEEGTSYEAWLFSARNMSSNEEIEKIRQSMSIIP